MGFSQSNTTSATTLTSNNVANLSSYKCIYVRITEDNKKCVENEYTVYCIYIFT